MNQTRTTWKEKFRRLLPPLLVQERGVVLKLGPTAGLVYARLRLLEWLGFRRLNATKAPSASRNIVFVCYGNLMRSPIAEAILLGTIQSVPLPGRQVTSAGLHAIPGKAVHPWALTVSQELGFPLSNHRARPLTTEIVEKADAIFAMDLQNKAELVAFYPASKHKIFMLSSYAEGAGCCSEIADPYFGDLDATRRCFTVIRSCVLNLASALATHDQSQSIMESSISS
jgi:protein-tyrosine-phosphatase